MSKFLAISQHAVRSWIWKSRLGQYVVEEEPVAQPGQRIWAKKITCKPDLGLNFAVKVDFWIWKDAFDKGNWREKCNFCCLSMTSKRSFLFLSKLKRWYSAKVADFFVFISHLNLKDFLFNAHKWQLRQCSQEWESCNFQRSCSCTIRMRKPWQQRVNPAGQSISSSTEALRIKLTTITKERLGGSCVLKASVDRVSVDTHGRHVGRYIDRYSTDMSAETRLTYRPKSTDAHVGRHLADSLPTLRQHYAHLVTSCYWVLSSLRNCEIIFSSPFKRGFQWPSSFFGPSFRQHSSMSFFQLCFFSRHRFYIRPSLLSKVAAFGACYFRRLVILREQKMI